MIKKVYNKFKDYGGTVVLWYWNDRYNAHGKHNPHPQYDMPGFDDLITRCLHEPAVICQDKDHHDRKCFYLDVDGDSTTGKYLKVVVHYNPIGMLPAALITAHFKAQVSPKEVVIWP
jgi:hypothetical protein